MTLPLENMQGIIECEENYIVNFQHEERDDLKLLSYVLSVRRTYCGWQNSKVMECQEL